MIQPNLTRELDEVARRLTVKHKCECRKSQNEKKEDILEFELSHGKYRLITDKVRGVIILYCEEAYSTKGYEYFATTKTANGVCLKIGEW